MDKEKKQATIYDYNRMCKSFEDCDNCPLEEKCLSSDINLVSKELDKINDEVLKWIAANPEPQKHTNLSLFKQIFPDFQRDKDGNIKEGYSEICSKSFDKNWDCSLYNSCMKCKDEFWNKERTDIKIVTENKE